MSKIHRLSDQVSASVNRNASIKGPWLFFCLPGASYFSTPSLDRSAAAALREMADAVDAAWADLDEAEAVAEAEGRD